MTIRIGISGWTYPPWRGVFYPKGLKQREELCFAARQFPSIEINGTFYGTQKPASFAKWHAQTPDKFMFSVKAPRYITHMLRLREAETAVANFLASGLLRLEEKLGPILWQFPPSFNFEPQTLKKFLKYLPRDTAHAAEVAKRHDARLNGSTWAQTGAPRPLRHAMEIRHESFRNPAFIDILRETQTALVCADTVEWPRLMDVTTDFIYCRLHGSEQLYASGYTQAALDEWAARVSAWASGTEPADAQRADSPAKPRKSGRDVFLYFDNDMKVRAPVDARALLARLEK